MPTIGWFEILIVVAIAIVVLGPKDFPDNVKKLDLDYIAKYINNIQNEVSNIEVDDKQPKKKRKIKMSHDENESIS